MADGSSGGGPLDVGREGAVRNSDLATWLVEFLVGENGIVRSG
jgi:hypothetical protein